MSFVIFFLYIAYKIYTSMHGPQAAQWQSQHTITGCFRDFALYLFLVAKAGMLILAAQAA